MVFDEPLFEIKECPFCGRTDNVVIMTPNFFNKVQDNYDQAMLEIKCTSCKVSMCDYQRDEHDYWKRREALVAKWNTRGGGV